MNNHWNKIRLLTPCTSIIEKLVVVHLLNKFTALFGTEISLQFSRQPATGVYPEQFEFRPHPQTLFMMESVFSTDAV